MKREEPQRLQTILRTYLSARPCPATAWDQLPSPRDTDSTEGTWWKPAPVQRKHRARHPPARMRFPCATRYRGLSQLRRPDLYPAGQYSRHAVQAVRGTWPEFLAPRYPAPASLQTGSCIGTVRWTGVRRSAGPA